MPIGRSSHTNILHSAKTSRNSSNLLSNFTLRNTKMVQFDIFLRRGSLYFYLYCGQSLGLNSNSISHLLLILCFLCYELPFSVLKLTVFIEKKLSVSYCSRNNKNFRWISTCSMSDARGRRELSGKKDPNGKSGKETEARRGGCWQNETGWNWIQGKNWCCKSKTK